MKKNLIRTVGRKSTAFVLACSLMCISALSGCDKQEETAEKAESRQVTTENKQEDAAPEEEITQKLQEVEKQWQEQIKQHDSLKQKVQEFLAMSKDVDSGQVQLNLEKKVVEAYRENVAIALEIKCLIAENLDMDAPAKFRTYSEDTQEMGEGLMQDAAISYALSYVGDDNIRDLLKDGIKGGMEEYTDSKSIESAVESAKNSVVDGVVCELAKAPLEKASDTLAATSKGIEILASGIEELGTVAGYVESAGESGMSGLISSLTGLDEKLSQYDETPGALLNSLSSTAKQQSEAIREFLKKETIASNDLSTAISSYMQFGGMLECMKDYGIGVDCDWQDNCKSAQALYEKFVSNEMMIEKLSTENNVERKPESYAPGFTEAEIPDGSFEPLENRDKSDTDSYYNQIKEEVSILEDENEKLQEISGKIDDIFSPLQEYRSQLDQIEEESEALLKYEEANIAFTVDTDGIEKIKEINKVNAGIGQVVGLIPVVGSTMGLFFSNAVANTDRYYQKLVNISTAFAKAQSDVAEQVRVDILEFKEQYAFYRELTREGTADEELQNLMVLDHILAGGKIDLSDSRRKAYQSLYLLGCGYDLTYKFYENLNPDNANGFANLYNEITTVLESDGMTEVMDNVTVEDFKKMLIPTIKAGTDGLYELEDISVPILDMDSKRIKVNINGGIWGGAWLNWWEKEGVKTHIFTDAMDVYFAGGNAVCINGLYIYNGIPLNGTADMDTVQSETQWMYSVNEEGAEEFSEHYHALITAVQSVEPIEIPDASDAGEGMEELPETFDTEGGEDLAESSEVSGAE